MCTIRCTLGGIPQKINSLTKFKNSLTETIDVYCVIRIQYFENSEHSIKMSAPIFRNSEHNKMASIFVNLNNFILHFKIYKKVRSGPLYITIWSLRSGSRNVLGDGDAMKGDARGQPGQHLGVGVRGYIKLHRASLYISFLRTIKSTQHHVQGTANFNIFIINFIYYLFAKPYNIYETSNKEIAEKL